MVLKALNLVWHAGAAWRGLLSLLVIVISWLAWSPMPPAGATLGWDKLNHASAFAALAFCAARANVGNSWHIAIGLIAYGALIEVVQTFVPGRNGEALDLLADGLGLAFGLLLAALIDRWLQPCAGCDQPH